ncbi:MAG: FAD-binding oxidoreductase [Verrucomicrobia bacterium]|nr:FAD-binding oxidoreductase [Verrucomicrobiota bacterium]MCG2680647.1 FAD-binding oxidoreductase [Kiritimatiellia bacterium]MBU4247429.1 FAD-binding oxidoreductase [Verrucomicrobiota bacterium]MBU4291487.1 FAD-binding oxidoreductase [Verrucomicrobiota bacterium]MBU4429670.1 FAD-binding oxidoreductase [Verrucomicrobiota bacterium]
MKTYDLVIIGAGSIGLPTALVAARQGLATLVLDRCASPGQGDHKRAIGGVRATHSDPTKIRICLRSIKIFTEWQQREGDDLGFRQGGYLFVAYRSEDEELLKGLLKIQKSHGLNINWIAGDQVKALVPGIREEGLRGGVYSPEDINVSPLRCASAFYFAAGRAGAEFKFQEIVTGIETKQGRVQAVKTDKGCYPARHVLNAAGAAASEMGRLVGLELPVFPDSHEAGITEPVEHLFDPMIVDIRPTPGGKNSYFFQNSENRIEFCLTPDPLFPGINREATSSFLPLVARKLVDLLPRLANIRVRRTWRGLYPQTTDGNPIVGSAREPAGYHYAVGMCGQGFMLGPGLAEDIVGLVKNGKPVTDEDLFLAFGLERNFSKTEKLK